MNRRDRRRQAKLSRPRTDGAAPLFERAKAAHEAGRAGEAADLYARVLEKAPRHPDALGLLGVLRAQAGDLEEAEALLRRAVDCDPGEASFHNNLGNVVSNLGRLEEAVACYLRSLELRPEDPKTLNNLGTVLRRQGRREEAERAYRGALRIAPGHAEAWSNLGNLLQDAGRAEEALDCQRRALALAPGYVIGLNNLATSLKKMGRHGEAEKALRRALELAPDYAEAASNLAECLKEQGEADQALGWYRKAARLRPAEAGIHDNFLLALNAAGSATAAECFAEHCRWGQIHGDPLCPREPVFAQARNPDKRLRVGYVSPDFRRHSCAYFIEPLLEGHDPAAVEVFGYASLPHGAADRVTDRLRGLAHHWRDIAGLDDRAAADLVRRDGIDILVDLAGHTSGSRLGVLAHRPAPVQVTWLGYPDTTGLKAVDYRIVDAWTDPPGLTDAFTVEELVRLPDGFLCYRPPEDAPPPERTPGPLTFGSCNNLAKVTPDVVALWVEVLAAVPDSRLYLKAKALADDTTRARIIGRFTARGIAPERLDLAGWMASGSHLAAYQGIDIGLDPFPYNGTTTTCEAFWMGVPVITLAGHRHAGRVGISLLSRLGLEDLVADGPDDYVAKAKTLAADAGRRATLRRDMRGMMRDRGMLDGTAFARRMEAAYRDMWRRWREDGIPLRR